MTDRISKYIAKCGICSRRDAEKLVLEGRIKKNGELIFNLATQIADDDIVTLDNKALSLPEQIRAWIYHKPAGLITTNKDPAGRPTIFDNLPKNLPRIVTVGRLDINSEGLLILTNSGELARKMELPSNKLVRKYRVRAYGSLDMDRLKKAEKGVVIEGMRYNIHHIEYETTTGNNHWINISLTEGKNREVRRVLEHYALKVNRLIRVSYGPFELGAIKSGEVKEISSKLIDEMLKISLKSS